MGSVHRHLGLLRCWVQGLQQTLKPSTVGLSPGDTCRILVRHNNQETLARILVCLELIVLGVYAGTTAQKEQELGGEMRVVARFCNVDLPLTLGYDPGDLRYLI